MRWLFFCTLLLPTLLPAQASAESPCDSSLQAYLSNWQQKLDARFERMPKAGGPDLSATYEIRLWVNHYWEQTAATGFETRRGTCHYLGEWETLAGSNLCADIIGLNGGVIGNAGSCTIEAFGNRWLRVTMTDQYIGNSSWGFTRIYYLEREF